MRDPSERPISMGPQTPSSGTIPPNWWDGPFKDLAIPDGGLGGGDTSGLGLTGSLLGGQYLPPPPDPPAHRWRWNGPKGSPLPPPVHGGPLEHVGVGGPGMPPGNPWGAPGGVGEAGPPPGWNDPVFNGQGFPGNIPPPWGSWPSSDPYGSEGPGGFDGKQDQPGGPNYDPTRYGSPTGLQLDWLKRLMGGGGMLGGAQPMPLPHPIDSPPMVPPHQWRGGGVHAQPMPAQGGGRWRAHPPVQSMPTHAGGNVGPNF